MNHKISSKTKLFSPHNFLYNQTLLAEGKKLYKKPVINCFLHFYQGIYFGILKFNYEPLAVY